MKKIILSLMLVFAVTFAQASDECIVMKKVGYWELIHPVSNTGWSMSSPYWRYVNPDKSVCAVVTEYEKDTYDVRFSPFKDVNKEYVELSAAKEYAQKQCDTPPLPSIVWLTTGTLASPIVGPIN